MNRHKYLRSVLVALLLPAAVSAQSPAYAKFGPNGETVGLYNLAEQSCGDPKVFVGLVSSVNSWKRRNEVDYRFAIDLGGGQRSFEFTLGIDEISKTDIGNLIFRGRRVRVRACRGRGRYWAVDEVTRASAQ